jgi:minor curlin subunit
MGNVRTFLIGIAGTCLLGAASARAQDLYPVDDLANTLVLVQQGSLLEAAISQTGSNLAEVSQVGVEQAVILEQNGFMNRTVVEQMGMDNRALVSQAGTANDAFVLQNGNANFAEIVQIGVGLNASVTQVGDNNTATIVQEQ